MPTISINAGDPGSPCCRICSKRYVHRTGNSTTIKVYSNQSEVSLYRNNELIETKQGTHIFEFTVPLQGTEEIKAISGSLNDTIQIEQVSQPDTSYQFMKKAVNWFDQKELNPDCYSINDILGILLQNEQTAAIVKQLMSQAGRSRGDVAASTAGNANLLKMMSGMTMAALLKKAGDAVPPPEALKQINGRIQKIHRS